MSWFFIGFHPAVIEMPERNEFALRQGLTCGKTLVTCHAAQLSGRASIVLRCYKKCRAFGECVHKDVCVCKNRRDMQPAYHAGSFLLITRERPISPIKL